MTITESSGIGPLSLAPGVLKRLLIAFAIWTMYLRKFSRSVMSNSLWPHGLYLAYQVPPFMGFSRQEYWKIKVKINSLSRVWLFVTVHGILQARILEWIAISFSRRSSRPRDQTLASRIAGRHFNLWATREAHVS